MLNHPTLDQLKAMRLTGMAQAFEEQLHDSNVDALSFDDRLAFLVDREHTCAPIDNSPTVYVALN